MSEYMEEHSVSKLIGAPPGYVGHDSGGQLIEQVRKNPYSIVLFDEIEKAHPKVFDIFLQILDEARLTDSSGRKADFQDTIIILTSNIGSKVGGEFRPPARPIGIQFDEATRVHAPVEGFDKAAFNRQVLDALQAKFRPELIGRIPHKIFFYPIQDNDLYTILRQNILPQVEQKFSNKRLSLQISDDACRFIIEKRDNRYGLRSIMELIDREIVNPLIKAIVDGQIHEGEKLQIDVVQGKIQWRHDIHTEQIR